MSRGLHFEGARPLARELELTLDLLRRARAEVLRIYATFPKVEDAPADITTQADRVSQEIILDSLHREFPSDGLCAEEHSATLERAGRERAAEGGTEPARIWVVDPIDGTRGFARKNGEFSIMIGLVHAGQVVLGAVSEPTADRVTYAVRGAGCFVRNHQGSEPIACSVTRTSGNPRTLTMSRSQGPDDQRRLQEAFGGASLLVTYSAGIKLAQVARGEADLYLGDYLTLHDWDVCAGHILVEEAGGRVTNIDGRPIRYDGSGRSLGGRGILASNGLVHPAALAVLASGKVRLSQ